MRKIAFDCETHLIKPGMLFPKLVCVTTSDGQSDQIFLASLGVQEILRYLRDPNIILVGHNIAFDLGVILAEAVDQGHDPHTIVKLVFQAYADNRIQDTMVRSMLVDIAQGTFQEKDGQKRGRNYGLDKLAARWIALLLQKADTWRLHYAALDGVPLAQWPQDAIDYAILDANVTFRIDAEIDAWAQREGVSAPYMIPDEDRQTRSAWVLHLMAGWGVRIDSEMVALVKSNLVAAQQAGYATMDQYGIFKKDRQGNYKLTKKGRRQKDQKVIKALITEGFAARGKKPPTTAGRVDRKTGVRVPECKIDADTARESGHPAAMALADTAGADKLLSTYIPALERGNGGLPVTSSPNVMVASGRTSWAYPNWQNPPQIGGIRECVIPRAGMVFVAADLDTVELRALAQSCLELFGFSDMAVAIQSGQDLHLALAAEVAGIDYATAERLYNAGDPTITELRQNVKAPNFGFPGGMGAKKFAQNQIDMGTPLIKDPSAPFSDHVARATFLREAWFRRWPEMRMFLANAGHLTDAMAPCRVEQPWSGRVRGGLEYCAAANTYFQGRVADGAKLALWRLAWACYVDETSILYGSRLVLFLHDEVILECPEALVDACALEVNKILTGAVQEVIPDIPITSKPVAMRRWLKGAKPVKVNGKLVPGKALKDASGKTTWIEDRRERAAA